MKSIEDLAEKVVSSSTVIEEEQAIERIWEQLHKGRISVEIFSLNEDGTKTNINDVDDLSVVSKVQAVFSKNSLECKMEWKPLKLDNVFILFRE